MYVTCLFPDILCPYIKVGFRLGCAEMLDTGLWHMSEIPGAETSTQRGRFPASPEHPGQSIWSRWPGSSPPSWGEWGPNVPTGAPKLRMGGVGAAMLRWGPLKPQLRPDFSQLGTSGSVQDSVGHLGWQISVCRLKWGYMSAGTQPRSRWGYILGSTQPCHTYS